LLELPERRLQQFLRFLVAALLFFSAPAPTQRRSTPIRTHPLSSTPHSGQALCGPETGARALLSRSRLSRVGRLGIRPSFWVEPRPLPRLSSQDRRARGKRHVGVRAPVVVTTAHAPALGRSADRRPLRAESAWQSEHTPERKRSEKSCQDGLPSSAWPRAG